MLVVWDTGSGIPIKSIFNPHPNGVMAMDISPDALFIVTLSAPEQAENGVKVPQMISLWEWTHPEREEALFTSVIVEPDLQKVTPISLLSAAQFSWGSRYWQHIANKKACASFESVCCTLPKVLL